MENRTTFVVAHRLTTIKNTDKIVLLDDGKIIDIGQHEELLQRNSCLCIKTKNRQCRNKIIVMFGNDNNRYKISVMKSRYRFETSNNFKIWPMHIIHICKLRLAKDIPQYLIIGKYLYSNEICKFISHVYRETIIIK